MKIKEYQSGGIIYTPFISSRGGYNQSSATTSSGSGSNKSDSDKTSDAIQKEIMDVLKENGLQNDVNAFLDKANSFLNSSRNLSTMSLFGGNEDKYTMSHLISILQMANGVKRNKGEYDLATANLKAEKAGNEAAIATNGDLYVIDKDYKMSTVSAETFYNNRDKYQALTNVQVLGLREKDPSLAYDTDILTDISSAIGMKTITDQITDIITKFGSISRTEYVQKTGEQISQKAWDGMQILLNNGPDGYYKATTKSEKESLESALMYLWDAIGATGQKKLAAVAATSGLDPHKNKYNIIMQALDLHTDYSQDVSFDASATKTSSDSNSEAKAQLEDDSYLSVIAKGKGIREQLSLTPSTTSPMGSQVGLKVWGINVGPLIDKNGNVIEQTSLPDALKRGEIFRGRPDNNVTFGNKILTPEEQKTIITDESAIVHIVELPFRETINGVVPDFSMVDKYKEVNELLKNTTNNIQRTELLIQHGIDPSKLTIDEDGNWSLKTKLFTRVPGYISEDLIDLTDDNKRFMDPVDESEGNQKRKLFNKILKYGIQNPGKNSESVHSTWNWFGGGDWDRGDMHRGYFYVTAPDEWIAALLTNQNKIDKHLLTDIDKRIYMSRAQQDSPLITQF